MQPFSDLLADVPRATRRSPSVDPGLAPALAWALAAGASIAARSHAVGLRDGVLRVELDAGDEGPDRGLVLRRQIESVAAELRAALNAILGPQQVQRLELTVIRHPQPSCQT